MNRRRVALGLIAFLALVCVGVPVAFQIGMAEGASRSPRLDRNLVEQDFGARGTTDFWDCYREVRLPALRQFDRMQDCRPPGEGGHAHHATVERHAYRGPSRIRNGALSRALTAAIAGGEPVLAGDLPQVPVAPFSLALAPDPLADPTSGPFAADSPQMPGVLIPPGFGGGFIPPGNPQDPETPEVETPLPGGLFLIATGIAGLAAALRRRKPAA
ncbi:MAG: hypothetical protein HXY23_03830 [Parvularculaceae bacterium]|nr:hypothetical protein [Parvularculaceae bacterium]